MRKLLLAALLSIAAFSSAFAADVYVRGYTRSDPASRQKITQSPETK